MAQGSRKRGIEETGCQSPEGPVLCTKGCGLFGRVKTMGLCSKCYTDLVDKQTMATSAKSAVEKVFEAPSVGEATTKIVEPLQKRLRPSVTEEAEESQRRPNKCYSCKKRVGLTAFKCRCGQTFCCLHRYSDKHSCTFDYKMAARDAIAKANPVVIAGKVEKI